MQQLEPIHRHTHVEILQEPPLAQQRMHQHLRQIQYTRQPTSTRSPQRDQSPNGQTSRYVTPPSHDKHQPTNHRQISKYLPRSPPDANHIPQFKSTWITVQGTCAASMACNQAIWTSHRHENAHIASHARKTDQNTKEDKRMKQAHRTKYPQLHPMEWSTHTT
jgi:hypothetical protein